MLFSGNKSNKKLMATAGYSGTPLIKKLGIKPETRILLLHAPDHYFSLLEQDLGNQLCRKGEAPNLVHLFAKDFKTFEKAIPEIKGKMLPDTAIWISWYKKSSGIATDLTEDRIRNFTLKNGLVDIQVCAVSDEWSGLKCVVPVKLR
jgi:hypothetical protein